MGARLLSIQFLDPFDCKSTQIGTHASGVLCRG
jgi:hypothetical protein